MPDPTQLVEDATTGVLLPNLEAKIVGDDGKSLDRGEKGHVYIRTPFAMKGYFNEPFQTSQTIMGGGWIKTGDIGWVNERDQFYIVGRQKVPHFLEPFILFAMSKCAPDPITGLVQNQG